MKNKCWVVKIGSALLTNNGKGIDKGLISEWVEQIVELKSNGIDVVLVSSGSIVEGMKRLGWKEKPSDIHKLQAAAAVGQMGLVQAYEYLFAKHKVQTAQVLLTRDNLLNSKHFENISATLITHLARTPTSTSSKCANTRTGSKARKSRGILQMESATTGTTETVCTFI